MSHKRSLFSLQHDVSAGRNNPSNLFVAAKGNLDLVQRLQLQCKLDVHRGCVNTICWNDTGEYILSGSDDQHLNIVNPYSQKKIFSIHSGHRANIFSAKFLPSTSDNHIVSCSGDGLIYFTDVQREISSDSFNCHFGTVYEVVTVPADPNSFLSCGEDGTVRWFDLRLKKNCRQEECKQDVLINCRRAVTSLAVDPVHPYYLAVGCSDSSARIFDRRMLGTRLTGCYSGRGITGLVSRFVAPSLETTSHRITSLQYSSDGRQVLVSYSSDYIYLFDVKGDSKVLSTQQEEEDEVEDEGCCASASCSSQRLSDKSTPPRQPPMKRLRLRGDWSDTGPRARPERERSDNEEGHQSPGASMMQRMSDMLTRWLNPEAQRAAAEEERRASQEQDDIETDQPEDSVAEMEIDREAHGDTVSTQALETPSVSADSHVESSSDDCIQEGAVGSSKTVEDLNIEQLPDARGRGTRDASSQHRDNVSAIDSSSRDIDREILEDTFGSSSLEGRRERTPVDMPDTVDALSENDIDDTQHAIQAEQDKGCSDLADGSVQRKSQRMDLSGSAQQSELGAASTSQDVTSSTEPAKPQHYVSGISLHYCSEGTTAGTVKLDFTTVAPDNHNQQQSGENPDRGREAIGSSEREIEVASEILGVTSDRAGGGGGSGFLASSGDDNSTPRDSAVLTEAVVSSVAGDESMRGSSDSRSRVLVLSSRRNERRSPSPATRPVPGLSRERAAIRLQELYRKRQELRESEEAASAKDVRQPPVRMCFKGHRNSRTMIKEASFWGDDYIMSGSDCGHIFIWDRHTAQLVNVLEADKHVVNCVQPHPFDPVLASSGIDYNIKIWMPDAEESTFDVEAANMVMKRNQTMLEETRDTITVPASFMLRMLASLNHLRSGRQADRAHEGSSGDSDPE